jgi:hypothetical protein
MAKFNTLLLRLALVLAIVAIFTGSAIQPGVRQAYGQQPYQYTFPVFFNQAASSTSSASTSYYVTTLNTGLLYSLGCELGTRDKNTPGAQDSVAVLAFGYPRCFAGGGYGANLFGFGPASTGNIRTAVEYFARGYYACSDTDRFSNLVIGVGTSNYQGSNDVCNTQAKATDHGKAWSGMVRDLNQWALNQGILHQVQFYGANDIELDWNTPAWSRAWVTGFEQVSGNFMLHFGDAAGCPYEAYPHWSCGTANYPGWTPEDVWYVSYGAPSALPLPLIYLTNGVHAKQWAYLSRYSVINHGFRMDFTGVFTQWAACQQNGNCRSTDNTPQAAYQQLTYELSKWPTTAQYLRWQTDIRQIKQSGVGGALKSQDELQDVEQPHPTAERAADLGLILHTADLSPEMRTSLESKQRTFQYLAEMVALSRANPAEKDEPLLISPAPSLRAEFESGLIENGEMPGIPYGARITTGWQAVVEDGYLQVGAGTSADDPQRGALYVLLSSADTTPIKSTQIMAPENCGPLTITGQDGHLLKIQSANGCGLYLDLLSWDLLTEPN